MSCAREGPTYVSEVSGSATGADASSTVAVDAATVKGAVEGAAGTVGGGSVASVLGLDPTTAIGGRGSATGGVAATGGGNG